MASHGILVGPGGVAGLTPTPAPDIQFDTYVDYMCPYCRHFERDNGAVLRGLVDEGRVRWAVHPLAFLDRLSQGTDYSTRAGAAAFAVAGLAPAAFGAFHSSLFAHQPKENTEGLDDSALARLASQAGVAADQAARLGDAAYVEAVLRETQNAIDLGVQGTPTVLATRAGVGRMMWDGEMSLPDMVQALENG
jgi:protein-disulfide isomerase